MVANQKVTEDNNKVAFERGPIVYCAEGIDNQDISKIAIPKDISLQVEEQSILSNDVTVLKGSVRGKELMLIPYYLWSNRGVGKMKVWFPVIQ